MKHKVSISSLVSIVLFMVITFVTAKTQTTFSEGDKLGWPFVFFSASNNHDLVTDQAFNALYLVLDLAISFIVGFGIVRMFSGVRVAHHHHHNQK